MLPLRLHRQQKHRVDRRHIAVQRHIATRGAADDELVFAVFHGSPDQGAMVQDLDGLQNFANALGRGAWVKLGDVLKETVEIAHLAVRGDLTRRALLCAYCHRALFTPKPCSFWHSVSSAGPVPSVLTDILNSTVLSAMMVGMNYLRAALWLFVIGASFGLGWGSPALLALGLAGPPAVLLWGALRV